MFDGATGTNLQLAGLTADDFGGPDLEGCNELLNVTRPDVIAELHDSFLPGRLRRGRDQHLRRVPTRARRVRASPSEAFELSRAGAAIAREVASGYAADGRPRFVVGSIGPGTKLPSLGADRRSPSSATTTR